MGHPSVFTEIAAILALATVLAVAGTKLRQPLIVTFLATGVLAGPSGLELIRSHAEIQLLAQIGISLLLFIVGLRLDLRLIRSTGAVALATGLGQVAFTSVIGFLIALALGFGALASAYIAVTLTFSSTIIIVKLLSDKKEIDSLHGRIAVGFLLVQDIVALLAMILLTALGGDVAREAPVLTTVAAIAGKGLGLLAAVALLMRFVLPALTERLARVPELLVLFAVAWALVLSAAGSFLGFSAEVGAFLGGVSLASTGYRDAVGARLVSLRDFLLLFFFIDLGARLDWSAVGANAGSAAVFSGFVLAGNPLIVLAIMGAMGYRARTGFLAGLTVAQISEFSLILAALGVSLGHIDRETMGLITLVGVVTIFCSTYMILGSAGLYRALRPALRLFERKSPYRESASDTGLTTPADILLIGLGNYGGGLAEHLLQRGRSLVGIDFDPQALETWRARGLPVVFGDVGDPELHEHLPLDRARWVVSSVRDPELNRALLQLLAARSFSGKIALAARDEAEAQAYFAAGAHVVLRPFIDAAEQAADALTEAMYVLPQGVDWPVAFREVRLRSGAIAAGQRIRDVPLRARTGASILAVSRAGRVHFDTGADFLLFPGDRVVLMGHPDELRRAEEYLLEIDKPVLDAFPGRFVMAEVAIAEQSPHAGQTLGELRFREVHGATVIGIHREAERIHSPGPDQRLAAGDRLIVVGMSERVAALRERSPL